jgi:branched-chain amino acid transport system substrate-binding protein
MQLPARPGRTAALVAAGLSALAIGACGDAQTATRPATLTVGALVSTTGQASALGAAQQRGVRLAVDQLNAAGGIDGTRLKLAVADDGSDPARGATEMRRLIEDGAVAVLGPTLSLVAVRAQPVANDLRTPVVAISNTVDHIVGDCAYPCEWIWRASVGAKVTVAAAIDYETNQRRAATAAIVRSDDDLLAASEAHVALTELRARGAQVAPPVLIPAGGTPAVLDHAVGRAIADQPDLLFVSSSSGDQAAGAIRAARAQGFTGQIIGGNLLNNSGVARAAGAAAAGTRTGAAWFAGNRFPANTAFVRAYRRAYGEAPDQFAAQAYAGVQIIAEAIERGNADAAGLSLEQQRQRIQDGMRKVALTTPLGPFRFTADHDVDQIAWILGLTGHGGHRLVGFCSPTC